eukprot:1617536-Prorocentrum_lima.AAC.1
MLPQPQCAEGTSGSKVRGVLTATRLSRRRLNLNRPRRVSLLNRPRPRLKSVPSVRTLVPVPVPVPPRRPT